VAAERATQTAAVVSRFAANLVVLRGRVDLSQQQTALRAGLHLTEISLLERGLRMPGLETIVKLGGAVEVDACELMAGMAWRLGKPTVYVGTWADRSECP
jgi:transcriptional regulator with XRE-family HTH domain